MPYFGDHEREWVRLRLEARRGGHGGCRCGGSGRRPGFEQQPQNEYTKCRNGKNCITPRADGITAGPEGATVSSPREEIQKGSISLIWERLCAAFHRRNFFCFHMHIERLGVDSTGLIIDCYRLHCFQTLAFQAPVTLSRRSEDDLASRLRESIDRC